MKKLGKTVNAILQVQQGFNMSLKPCLNLCSRWWLKPNRNLVNNFIPIDSLVLKVFLLAGLSLNNILQNRLYKVELRMSGSNLFYSLMTSGMKEFLKYSDLRETILNELTCRRELLIDGSKL